MNIIMPIRWVYYYMVPIIALENLQPPPLLSKANQISVEIGLVAVGPCVQQICLKQGRSSMQGGIAVC